MNAIPAVEKAIESATGDEKTGMQIVLKALEEQIAENAGLEGSVIVASANKVGYGFNAFTEEYVDMIDAGIIDPTKVTRSALQMHLLQVVLTKNHL